MIKILKYTTLCGNKVEVTNAPIPLAIEVMFHSLSDREQSSLIARLQHLDELKREAS